MTLPMWRRSLTSGCAELLPFVRKKPVVRNSHQCTSARQQRSYIVVQLGIRSPLPNRSQEQLYDQGVLEAGGALPWILGRVGKFLLGYDFLQSAADPEGPWQKRLAGCQLVCSLQKNTCQNYRSGLSLCLLQTAVGLPRNLCSHGRSLWKETKVNGQVQTFCHAYWLLHCSTLQAGSLVAVASTLTASSCSSSSSFPCLYSHPPNTVHEVIGRMSPKLSYGPNPMPGA